MKYPSVNMYDKPRQRIKKQRHYFAEKGPSSQSYGFSSSHIWLSELDYKESWVLKNWCFWTVVFEELDMIERLNNEQQQQCLSVLWMMMSRDQECRNHQPASACDLWGLGSFRLMGILQGGKGKAWCWCNRYLGKQTSHRVDWPLKRQLDHLP